MDKMSEVRKILMMSNALEYLPFGWVETTIGQVVINRSQKVSPEDDPEAHFIGMDSIEPNSMALAVTYRFGDFKSAGNQFLKGDVLYGRMRPYLNKVCVMPYGGACSGEFIVMKTEKCISPNYLQYLLHDLSFVRFSDSIATGDRPRVSFKDIGDYKFPLPPLAEQDRIVAKIEELFSSLDKGIESLTAARAQLKVYRQAVLKRAFEGKLTNKDVKDGELPEGWKVIELGELLLGITAGKSFKCEERPPRVNEVGVVKVSAVTWGTYDEDESKTITDSSKINSSYLITSGDFLFSRANTLELIGAAVIADRVNKRLQLSDKILRLQFNKEKLNNCYVLHFLRSQNGRKQIQKNSSGNQESMRNIGQDGIKRIIIPLPQDTIEQKKIVAAIESRLSVCDKLEESIESALLKAEALRQSILKKAFEGKLVPQDPNDEPAGVLLERIRAEREKNAARTSRVSAARPPSPGTKSPKKRGRPKKEAEL